MRPVLGEILGGVALVAAATLGFLGARFTARESRQAADAATEVAEATAEVAARKQTIDELLGLVQALGAELTRLREQSAAELAHLRDRVAALETALDQERAVHRRRYGALLAYVRAVLAWVGRVAPGQTPPDPDPLIAEDL